TRFSRDWSSDVCSSDLQARGRGAPAVERGDVDAPPRGAEEALPLAGGTGRERGVAAGPQDGREPVALGAQRRMADRVDPGVEDRSEERRAGKDGSTR